MDLCLPKTVRQKDDNIIYKEIQTECLNLAFGISNELNSSNLEKGTLTNEFLKSATDNRFPQKRKLQQIEHNAHKDKVTSEFIDSDIEDDQQQIQKLLGYRKKKKMDSKLARSLPDPRSKILEFRLFDHFENKTDEEFFHYLRVTKGTFKFILDRIKESGIFSANYGNFPVQAEQALQMFLYYVGYRCTYKFLSQMYHIARSTIMTSFTKCIEGINRLDDKEVRWPSSTGEVEAIQRDFKDIAGVPGVIGSIGGCCVEMRTKKEPPAGYKIGKLRSIMYLLGVTDAQSRFIYIQAGFPGTFSVQEAFESSSLGEMMKANSSSLFMDEDTHLIGNTDFTLHKHLIVPYSKTGTVSQTQIIFNEKLIESNVCDKAFTTLKSRFTSLRTQVFANLERIPNIIKACCIIHNIALKDSDDRRYLEKHLMEDMEDYSSFRDDSDFLPSKPDRVAFNKRDLMASKVS